MPFVWRGFHCYECYSCTVRNVYLCWWLILNCEMLYERTTPLTSERVRWLHFVWVGCSNFKSTTCFCGCLFIYSSSFFLFFTLCLPYGGISSLKKHWVAFLGKAKVNIVTLICTLEFLWNVVAKAVICTVTWSLMYMCLCHMGTQEFYFIWRTRHWGHQLEMRRWEMEGGRQMPKLAQDL